MFDLSKHHTKEQVRNVAPNSNIVSTMRRLVEEQQNEMANYIVSHMLDVIKPIVINAMDDALSRSRSSNQPLIFQLIHW